MKIVTPDPLLRFAADALAAVRDDIVVIGASAVRVALHGRDVALSPTRDVDAGTRTEDVDRVVAALEAAGLTRSPEPHEHAFTWIRDDHLKVQLIRPFHPFPKGDARRLPVNNTITELARHRDSVAFDDAPGEHRLWCANAAALVGLKAQAFGRTRHDGKPVDRDFSDAALLLANALDDITAQVATDTVIRGRVTTAARRLLDDQSAADAAVRELVATDAYPSVAAARRAVAVAAERALRRIDA
ncbi:MAG: hypothetical protein Q8O56_18250 [Solirubrobacteraceae bacterium]|nr:hypothetical protein [Solirubrobacteraceae bacterium]